MEEQYAMAFDAILEELKNRGNNKSEQGTIFEDFCKMILEKAPLFSKYGNGKNSLAMVECTTTGST